MKTTLKILALTLVLLLSLLSCEKIDQPTLISENSLQPTYLCEQTIPVIDQVGQSLGFNYIPLLSIEFSIENNNITYTYIDKVEYYNDWTFETKEDYWFSSSYPHSTVFLITSYKDNIKYELVILKTEHYAVTDMNFSKDEYDYLVNESNSILFDIAYFIE